MQMSTNKWWWQIINKIAVHKIGSQRDSKFNSFPWIRAQWEHLSLRGRLRIGKSLWNPNNLEVIILGIIPNSECQKRKLVIGQPLKFFNTGVPQVNIIKLWSMTSETQHAITWTHKAGKLRLKSEGNSKLGYRFKCAVASERRRMCGNIPRNVHVITVMTVIKMVGGDETGFGYGRVPGFANAPES